MRKCCKNADEGVVLVAIQIAVDSDLSTERTVPPRSTHVQPGDVSHALIQQGERERLRKTPSNSSTTAWWWWRSVAIPQGFAKHHGRGGVGREVGLHQEGENSCVWQPQTSNIYRGGRGLRPHLGFPPQGVRPALDGAWGGGQEGERGEACLGWALGPICPRVCPLPLSLAPWVPCGGRTSPPGTGSLPHLAHAALRAWWPHLVDPRDLPGGPGTLPEKPETFPVTKTGLPIYKSLPPDHSGTPRDVRDLIRDSEQHSVTTYKLPL